MKVNHTKPSEATSITCVCFVIGSPLHNSWKNHWTTHWHYSFFLAGLLKMLRKAVGKKLCWKNPSRKFAQGVVGVESKQFVIGKPYVQYYCNFGQINVVQCLVIKLWIDLSEAHSSWVLEHTCSFLLISVGIQNLLCIVI